MSGLKEQAERFRAAGAHAERTKHEYAADWRHFSAWCRDAGREVLPATEETLELYLTHYAAVHKVATLRRRLAAIASQHEDLGHAPPAGRNVRRLLRGIARRKGSAPARKAAITPDQLRAMCEACDIRTPFGARDRALLLIGFASGLRRSNLAALQLEDVRLVDQGLIVRVEREKNDQEGAGRAIGVFPGKRASTCPVRALRAWLRFRGCTAGPLFVRLGDNAPELAGITDRTVYDIVRAAAARAGLDPGEFGAHSLRAGMVTAAHVAGASDTAVARRSGHKSLENLARYVRDRDLFSYNPLAKAL